VSHFQATRARLFPATAEGRLRAQAAGLVALCEDLDEAQRTRVKRRAAGDLALHEREARLVGECLSEAGIACAGWKGAAAAALWPTPASRPVGDLDVLVGVATLEAAAAALGRVGYRRAPGEKDGLFRRGAATVELLPPASFGLVVDLHERPFRSVGHRLRAEALIARASRTPLHPLPQLAPLDHALLVLVHGAKHGLSHPKWRLDVAAVADRFPTEPLFAAAREHRLERAARAALAAVGACAPEPGPSGRLLSRLLRPQAQDAPLDRLPRLSRYLLELLLEESTPSRLRMGVGYLEGLARAGKARSPRHEEPVDPRIHSR